MDALANEIILDIRQIATHWRRRTLIDFEQVPQLAVTAAASVGRKPLNGRHSAAQFVVATKGPHIVALGSLTRVLARMIAYGVEILGISYFEGTRADQLAKLLYPTAAGYYERFPESASEQQALAATFDVPDFKRIFGENYSPELVISGAAAAHQWGIDNRDLMQIWEEGRTPIDHDTLVERYGRTSADYVCGDDPSYAWFRGRLPLGIHRISSGIVAFAMRNPRVNGGRTAIVLNGHFPGLTNLFNQGSYAILAGLAPGGPGIGDLRQEVVGHDNRPEICARGTIRGDAATGLFRTDSPDPVDSRQNLVHCSDGPIAGIVESHAIFNVSTTGDFITNRLVAGGLTDEEIRSIVLANPIVGSGGADSGTRLTDATRGLDVSASVESVLRYFPPVFGPANQHAFGVTLGTFTRELLCDPQNTRFAYQIRSLRSHPRTVGEIEQGTALRGVDVIAKGAVGLVAPAGGTGGRFGGYEQPENDIRRQKALVKQFVLDGEERSCLDIRLANASFWQERTSGRVPLAVMGSVGNVVLLRQWSREVARCGVADVDIYVQAGVYRVEESWKRHSSTHERWFDHIVRNADGRPSLKPAGTIGMFIGFALSGILKRWADSGVQYVAFANGDDVGFRLDPRMIGYLDLNPEVDSIVVGVPWGITGSVQLAGTTHEVRGDISGWALLDGSKSGSIRRADHGRWRVVVNGEEHALDNAAFDRGGCLCEIRLGDSWRVGAVEAMIEEEGSGFPPYNTNHFYLRLRSLQRFFDSLDPNDITIAAKRLVDMLPFTVETKAVPVAGQAVRSLQLAQAAHAVLPHLGTVVPVIQKRSLGAETISAFSPLKVPADVRFAQALLDRLQTQLRFPPVRGR